MKIKLLFLIVFIGCNLTRAQDVVFEDQEFKNYLLENYPQIDTNGDGTIQVSEAETYTDELVFNYQPQIMSMKDISHFPNISKFYLLNMTQISEVDLSANTKLTDLNINFTNISFLDVSNNTRLVSIDVQNNSQFSHIDLGSSQPYLQMLNVSFNALTSLDASPCPDIRALYLTSNHISSIDTSGMPRLEELNIGGNLFTDIDVSANTRLRYLNIAGNNISNLDVTHNPKLNMLMVNENPIASLDVSQQTVLTQLVISYTNIENIDLSHCKMLQYFYSYSSKLKNLDASQNPNLIYLQAESNADLSQLNFRNGGNKNVWWFWVLENPNLKCIEVDDPQYSNASSDFWYKDDWAVYSSDCSLGTATVLSEKAVTVYPNPTQGPVRISTDAAEVQIISTTGQLISTKRNTNSIELTNYPKGVYLLKIRDKEGNIHINRVLKK